MQDNLSLGRLGEKIASEYLQKYGHKIIEMNFRKRWGEIDIISIDSSTHSASSGQAGSGQATLVFIEVKTRMENDRISPEDSMTAHKINTVKKTALFYKAFHKNLPECLRIDFIGIVLDDNLKTKRINYVRNISS